MSLYRKALPGLYDGVSQQSATMRTPLQCEAQVNAWATIADGLSKRPPSEHVAVVSNTSFGPATIHHINRDTAERYIVIVTDGDLKVYDHETGAQVTVTFPTGKSYLDCANAATDFALVTVADYTFVVNRTVTCALEAPAAVVDRTDYRWINREFIPEAGIYPGAVYQYEFGTTTGDLYMGEKQTFEDLPDTASPGHIYKIVGSGDNGFSAYYVRRVGGVWEEYRDPYATQHRISATTMPHALVREASGTFTFAPFSWAERKVGDANTNPTPTFIGRPIRDVFFVQNRLGFLVDENLVLSCSGDFGNFWRNTVTAYVASDTIDVAVTGSKVSVLYHAIPFQDSVLLFSDQMQFALTWGNNGLTPDSVALTPITTYVTNTTAKPIQVGRDLYFCANGSGYSRVYEYYNRPAEDGTATQAADITAHVPKYVPKDITKIAADGTGEALFLVSPLQPSRVYVYKFAWRDSAEKSQSNWGYWQFDEGATVLSVEVLEDYLYLLIQRTDGVSLERVNMQTGASAPGMSHQVLLDRRVALTGTYSAGTDRTTFQLPFSFPSAAIRVVKGSGSATPGALMDPAQYTFPNTGAVSVPGNLSGHQCVVGLRYTFSYTFSPQFVTTDSGAILTGRTILRSMTVYFTNTAYFATEVAPYGDAPQVESVVAAKLAEFTGRTLGLTAMVLGSPTYATGDYSFQIYGEADVARVTLSNDTHAPCTFQTAECEITYHNRAR